MTTNAEGTIPGTEEAWDEGILGSEEKYVGHLSPEELAAEATLIHESMGLQPISIRLERALIEDFKAIATIHGLGYQTLMRQALKRFADCEKKQLLRDVAAQARARTAEHATAVKKATKQKKAA